MPCNTPVGGSDVLHELLDAAGGGGGKHTAPRKKEVYKTHHWTHTELGPGSGSQQHGRKKKEQQQLDDGARSPRHAPHVPHEADLYQVLFDTVFAPQSSAFWWRPLLCIVVCATH